MCGICGIFNMTSTRPIDAAVLRRMTEALRHRGPDGEGAHVDGIIGLGHRRLSIIDLARGKQPMCNEDRSIWVTYNGEIYNHGPLRDDLQTRGHEFRDRVRH